MERLEYEIETLTPLFCHGKDKETVELRASSIKGLMRYWWRIIKMGENNFDINKLREEENKTFGSTENKSPFKIRIETIKEEIILKEQISSKFNFINNIGLKYIWMMGPVSREGHEEIYNKVIYPAKYKIIITFYDKVNDDVKKSFETLILFGGLGGKSRRGMGKFYVNNLNYKSYLLKNMKLIFLDKNFKDYIELLNFLGSIFLIYKSSNKYKLEKKYQGYSRNNKEIKIVVKKFINSVNNIQLKNELEKIDREQNNINNKLDEIIKKIKEWRGITEYDLELFKNIEFFSKYERIPSNIFFEVFKEQSNNFVGGFLILLNSANEINNSLLNFISFLNKDKIILTIEELIKEYEVKLRKAEEEYKKHIDNREIQKKKNKYAFILSNFKRIESLIKREEIKFKELTQEEENG